ncbi:MAG: class I adenylate-forming enzyme family protein [Sphingomonadales bacterium]
MHFARHLSYWARMRADRPAVTVEGDTLTWSAFDAQAESLAARFVEMGVTPGDRVGCLLGNSLEWCVAFAAAIKAEAIFVPFNAAFGPVELREIEADAAPRAIVSTASLMRKLGGEADGDEVMLFDRAGGSAPQLFAQVAGSRLTLAPRDYRDDGAPLAISYTSGTMGQPKGVVLSHAAVHSLCTGLALAYGWTPEERFLIVAPLAFTGGFICCLAPVLFLGAHAFVERKYEAGQLLARMADERITTFGGVPTLFQRIADCPGFAEADLSSLRHGFTGGAPVSVPLLKAFQAKGLVIRQSYGCTEACGFATLPDATAALTRPGAAGWPMMGMELEVHDDAGNVCGQGEVGEIWLRGTQMLLHYWNKPDLTAQAHQDGWYKTGDLGKLDEHGAVVVVDRKKNMIISGGVNVYPAEVERTMATLPGVSEIVVLGLPSAEWGEEVVAIVHGDASAEDLIGGARALLGSYKAPKRIRKATAPLPRTTSGKIERRDLAALFHSLAETELQDG